MVAAEFAVVSLIRGQPVWWHRGGRLYRQAIESARAATAFARTVSGARRPVFLASLPDAIPVVTRASGDLTAVSADVVALNPSLPSPTSSDTAT